MLGHTKKLPLSGWKCKFCRFMSQERTPPSSLLQRQAKRRGIQPTVAPSQLIVTSLKDIFSSFNPAGYAPEDEELEVNQQREDTMRKIEHGDLRNLLLRKLSAQRVTASQESPASISDLRIPLASIVQVFPNLSEQELALIKVALSAVPPTANWNSIGIAEKQLIFYLAYGSYGPRQDVSFSGSKPEDFTWRKASPLSPGVQQVKKLPKNELTDIWTCTPSRRKHMESMRKGLDPGTRVIAWAGLAVALIATFKEYNKRKNPDATVQIAEFIETVPSQVDDAQPAHQESRTESQVPPETAVSPSNKRWFQFWRR